ncbi:hypothetical protein PVK06_039831 [Gossypium arboreum]|uniref:Uncharacterized protein n=1 Tax=Gossypium arboreum TaxID=29729 RepID=A0ABR0N6N2_GOSAR|nr:hypothetical protein PVK06_039831 [Gossypium arboreum]
MTQGKETLILQEVETSKTRKGKAKSNRKGTNMNTETSLWRKLKDVEKMVSDTKKEEKFRDIDECLRKIDSLFELVFLLIKKTLWLKRKLMLQKRKLLLKKKKFQKMIKKKEKEKEDFFEKVVTHPNPWVQTLKIWSELERDQQKLLRSLWRSNTIHRQ